MKISADKTLTHTQSATHIQLMTGNGNQVELSEAKTSVRLHLSS